ncbi:helix-turn-helix domain-containing protein [Streptomyces seoulensis]
MERLTGREKEVLLLVGTGVANRRLARELGIAERTVKAHLARIAEKLGQQTRLQIALIAVAGHSALCTDASCAHACPAEPDEFDDDDRGRVP